MDLQSLKCAILFVNSNDHIFIKCPLELHIFGQTKYLVDLPFSALEVVRVTVTPKHRNLGIAKHSNVLGKGIAYMFLGANRRS